MKHAVVLMTALLPTRGHAALCEFAAGFPDTKVWVLINSRSHEPVSGELRVAAVSEALSHLPQVTVRHSLNDLAPQNPADHPHFWQWWQEEIDRAFPEVEKAWTYVVASEPYGALVAKSLGAVFMPYDVGRELNPVRGVEARRQAWEAWPQLLPAARRAYQLRATLFGQESVGKTTISKRVAELLEADWLFEYARSYLATVGLAVTVDAMAAIHRGQAAVQHMAFTSAATPALILDTDLFSTVGYYPIMGEQIPETLLHDAHALASDVYYLLGDDAPFVPDPQRYGGDRRESAVAHWEQLLQRENLPYVRVPAGSVEAKAQFIAQDVRRRFEERVVSLATFERE